MQLRDYQEECLVHLWDYLKSGGRRGLIVAPTGSGKSHIIAEAIKRPVQAEPQNRALIIGPGKEIISQNAEKLLQRWPAAPLGIYCAGLGKKRVSRITFAGIASIQRKPEVLGFQNAVFIDECHLIPKTTEGMYWKVLNHLLTLNPNLIIVGLTATPYRTSTGILYGEDGSLFTDLIHQIEISDLINRGHLCRLVGKTSKSQADLSAVKVRAGEYVSSDLHKAFDIDELTESIVDEVIERGQTRKSWLLFCASVSHAAHVLEKLKAKGIIAAVVTGDTPRDERDNAFKNFKQGRIRALVGCDVFTTGFDAPNVDLIALLRATKSTGLYVQILGRGMRPCEGKEDCLVLDYGNNIKRHGPVDLIRIKEGKRNKREIENAPTKTCPECDNELSISVMECPCGYIFEKSENLDSAASEEEPMGNVPKYYPIDSIEYDINEKEKDGKISRTLKIRYQISDLFSVYQFLCFEHQGWAKKKARAHWFAHGGQSPAPKCCEEACDRLDELVRPKGVYIQRQQSNPKFFEVVRVEFPSAEEIAEKEEAFEWALAEGIA